MGELQISSESSTAGFDVGAGNIDFQSGNTVGFRIEFCGNFGVFLNGYAPHIDDDGGAGLFEAGQIVFIVEELIHAGALQADGVEHTAGDFGDTGGRVAVRGDTADTFDHDRTEAGKVIKFGVFHTVTEGSGSGHHRVFKGEFSKIY